jgi:AcrR family transcriptional regulator
MTRRAGLDSQAVIEEAAKLINEEGLELLSLARLAERLGVRVPSLYNHVAGLPGLKRDLALYSLREVLMLLTRSLPGKAGREAIFAFADTYRDYARRSPGHYALTLLAPAADDKAWQELGGQIIELARAVLAPYNLDEEEAIHAIRSLRSIVHGFVSLELVGGFGMPVDLNASFRWLIDLFVTGLEQPGPDH